MDQAAQPFPPQSGLAGAQHVVKTTIATKTKEVVILLAVMTLVILVLAYKLYTCSNPAKEGYRSAGVSTSGQKGGNLPKGFRAEFTGPISVSDSGYHPSYDAGGYATDDTVFVARAYDDKGRLVEDGLRGLWDENGNVIHSSDKALSGTIRGYLDDEGSVADLTGQLGDSAALKVSLGSACSRASSMAVADQRAHALLNGGANVSNGASLSLY